MSRSARTFSSGAGVGDRSFRTAAAAVLLAVLVTGCAAPPHQSNLTSVMTREHMIFPDGLRPYRCTMGAHRGASVDEIENTLDAIRLAEDNDRYAFIEFDVQYTRDRRIVLFHDQYLLRVFGKVRTVGGSTYEELKELTGNRIATYGEVMDIVTKKINIEIKSRGDAEEDARLVDEIVADLQRRGRLDDVMISSIDPGVLRYLAEHHPGIPRGRVFWITSSTYLHLDRLTEGLYEEMTETSARYLMLHVANLRNIQDLLKLKPPDSTIVFWDFDDNLYLVHKDSGDRMWGTSRISSWLHHLRYRLFGPKPSEEDSVPVYRGAPHRFS